MVLFMHWLGRRFNSFYRFLRRNHAQTTTNINPSRQTKPPIIKTNDHTNETFGPKHSIDSPIHGRHIKNTTLKHCVIKECKLIDCIIVNTGHNKISLCCDSSSTSCKRSLNLNDRSYSNPSSTRSSIDKPSSNPSSTKSSVDKPSFYSSSSGIHPMSYQDLKRFETFLQDI